MNRFYIHRNQLNSREQTAYITDKDDIKHITKSLRMFPGDQIELCAGEDESYLAEIDQIDHNKIYLLVHDKIDSRELPVRIDLFQGIPKGQKWDFLIQKAVECGIDKIYPVQLKRCVSIIREGSESKKLARWQKIADEAAKQSKRSYCPQVHPVHDLTQALTLQTAYDLVLIAYEGEATQYLKHYQQAVKDAKNIAIWVGPEGGFEYDEVAQLAQHGKVISLGKRILRTESAAMVLLSQIGYIVEP